MSDIHLVIIGLAVGTFAVRFAGVLVGQKLPRDGAWTRALEALPGCLILSLVLVLLSSGGPREWAAGILALITAIFTRSLPLTMCVGIAAIWVLRNLT